MPKNAKFKMLIRARMERTGESYTQARAALLRERDQGVGAVTLDPIRARIVTVMEAQPELSFYGFRTRPERGTDPAAAAMAFTEERALFLSESGVRQIASCLEFLALLRRSRTAKPSDQRSVPSSYALKHDVEAWLRASGKTDSYISNGALIVAALIAGVSIHRDESVWSPNCSVGVLAEDVRAFHAGKDPREWKKTTAFVKWLFSQAGRGDPVGDLAMDAKADFNFPRRGNVAEIRAYLGGYSNPVQEAFAQARREYRALP